MNLRKVNLDWPLFNQLERGSNLLWEPGQVFEKKIGIDRASFCLNEYLWKLHGHNSNLGGCNLRNRNFRYIFKRRKPNKILPDFSLNLFIQAKRSNFSARPLNKLRPYINRNYWFFEITVHQQRALEQLERELHNEALVIYAAPLFNNQQDLYNHTVNNSVVEHSTFPKVSKLSGHSKWYFDRPGSIGVANPDFEFFDEVDLIKEISKLREKEGRFNNEKMSSNLHRLSKSINSVVEKNSNQFLANQFASNKLIIEELLFEYDLEENIDLKNFMEIEAFATLWKLNWLTF